MDIGSIIKKARNDALLTQEQAAEELGVSRQTISNWENGKSYPDIVSVIKMSDLYSISLDHLLKEDSTVDQSYQEFLEESTNTVKSKDRLAKLVLILSTLGIWVVTVLAYWYFQYGSGGVGFSMLALWAVLPVLFFTVACLIGRNNYFGFMKWGSPVLFGGMYAATGSITVIAYEGYTAKSVIWPDLSKLAIGFVISAVGLGIGVWLRKKSQKK